MADDSALARLDTLQASLIQLRWRPSLETPTLSASEALAKDACLGRWAEVIQATRELFTINASSLEVDVAPYPAEATPEGLLRRLAAATALLSAYVQISFTGPNFPLEASTLFETEDEDALNSTSLRRLPLAGEPAYHLAKGATYLLLALRILEVPLDDAEPVEETRLSKTLRTVRWWRLRARLLQHRLVDERIPFSPGILEQAASLASELSQTTEASASDEDASADQDLVPMLTLELGLAETVVGNERAANELFLRAVTQSQLKYDLTGVLGKRTKFQEKDVTQLVVLAVGRDRPQFPPKEGASKDAVSQAADALEKPDGMPTTLPLNDDTLLERTKYTSTPHSSPSSLSSLSPQNQPPLYPLDQCLLLALSLSINNTSPSHGLTSTQIAPFVSRVLENPGNWSVHSMALLLRSRLEASRTRTVERGLLQHQALVDQLAKEDAAEQADGLERVRWTWGLDLPARWELERELARKLQAMGVTRSALEIFERLEMWDDVVSCYRSMDRRDKGVQVVKDLLSGEKEETGVRMGKERRDGKREAKLWCLLGELEGDPEHWRRAWSVSCETSSRAMRSLGAYHFARSEYAEAQSCLAKALKINPLFTRSWFVLGCAAMRGEEWDAAEVAFGRCVALDDEDAEGWNNLASVHLRRAETEPDSSVVVPSCHSPGEAEEDEAVDEALKGSVKLPFSRRRAAFYCLQRAAKLSYDSWRIWANLCIVSIDVGEFSEACRALGRVVERRGQEGLDFEVVERLVGAAIVEGGRKGDPNSGEGLRARVRDLFERVLLVKCASSARVFLLYAKLLSSPSASDADLIASLEAYLSAYRVGVSQNEAVSSSPSAFADACETVQLCIDALRNFGQRERKDGGGLVKRDWKWQARTLLRGFLARTKEGFEDEVGWERLKAELDDLK